MTIGDYPEYLALGFLANQNIISFSEQDMPVIEYHKDIETVVVRTEKKQILKFKKKKNKNFRMR